jgi:hypothetical protein
MCLFDSVMQNFHMSTLTYRLATHNPNKTVYKPQSEYVWCGVSGRVPYKQHSAGSSFLPAILIVSWNQQ